MFNYQSKIYMTLRDKIEQTNITKEDVIKRLSEFSEDIHSTWNTTSKAFRLTSETIKRSVPQLVHKSPWLEEVYADWQKYYEEAYQWIHPHFVHFW